MKILGLPTSVWFSALFIVAGVTGIILLRYFTYKKGFKQLAYTPYVLEVDKDDEE